MKEIKILEKKDDNLLVSGTCSFDTVAKLNKLGCGLIPKYNMPVFDLHELQVADISGLTLLLAWTRCAYKYHRQISFVHVPEQLNEMIKLVGLETILKIN
jgi:ABC-type transporter Mla MlaB component